MNWIFAGVSLGGAVLDVVCFFVMVRLLWCRGHVCQRRFFYTNKIALLELYCRLMREGSLPKWPMHLFWGGTVLMPVCLILCIFTSAG